MEEVHGILRRIWNAKEEYAMSNGSGWIHKEQQYVMLIKMYVGMIRLVQYKISKNSIEW